MTNSRQASNPRRPAGLRDVRPIAALIGAGILIGLILHAII